MNIIDFSVHAGVVNGKCYRAAYYLQGQFISMYFPDREVAMTWLLAEVRNGISEGTLRLSGTDDEPILSRRVVSTLHSEGIPLGVSFQRGDPQKRRMPSVFAAVQSEKGKQSRQSRSVIKHGLAACYVWACMRIVDAYGLSMAHFNCMLTGWQPFLRSYGIWDLDAGDFAQEAALGKEMVREALARRIVHVC